MARHTYTAAQRAAALAALTANGSNLRKTARESGIPFATLRQWAKDGGVPVGEEVPLAQRPPPTRSVIESRKNLVALLEPARGELADATEAMARRLLGGLTDEKIAAMPGDKIMVAYGIAVEKTLLLRGEATSIVGRQVSDEQRLARLRELAERGRARRLGLFDPGGASGVGQPSAAGTTLDSLPRPPDVGAG